MKINHRVLTVMVVAMCLSGCAGSSRLADDYGTSFGLAKFNQVLVRDGQPVGKPVEGIDGPTAKAIMDAYHKKFEKPAQAAPVLTLGIVGAGK